MLCACERVALGAVLLVPRLSSPAQRALGPRGPACPPAVARRLCGGLAQVWPRRVEAAFPKPLLALPFLDVLTTHPTCDTISQRGTLREGRPEAPEVKAGGRGDADPKGLRTLLPTASAQSRVRLRQQTASRLSQDWAGFPETGLQRQMSHQPRRVSRPAPGRVSRPGRQHQPPSVRRAASESARQEQLVRLQQAGPGSHPPQSLSLHLHLPRQPCGNPRSSDALLDSLTFLNL